MPRRSGRKSNHHESPDGDLKNMDPAAVETISNILDNIIQLKTNCGIENLEETGFKLSAVLNSQPVEYRQHILDFARSFYNVCRELYEPKSSIAEHEENENLPTDVWNIDTGLDNLNPESTELKKGEGDVYKSPSKGQSVKSIFDDHNSSTETRTSDVVSQARSATSDSTDVGTIPATSSPEPRDDDSDVGEDGPNSLREQNIGEFIDDARDQLLRMGTAELHPQGPEKLTILLDSLDDNNTNLPSGSEWFSLIEKRYGDRQRGTIYYALAAVGFEKWYTHEVKQKSQFLKSKTVAIIEVSTIILGLKPVPTTKKGDWDKRDWERRRKNLSTHLTRGQKWRELIDAFGHGILFMNPWRLAKTKNSDLRDFTKKLKNDSRKCLVLKLLEKQINLLIKEGRTDESQFCMQLRENGFRLLDDSIQECLKIELREFRNNFGKHDLLQVGGTRDELEVEWLEMLGPRKWLNNDLIVACMHFSPKLPFVHIGWSIKIHSSDNGEVLSKPFSGVGARIKKWIQQEAEPKQHVYFFPLYQRLEHFSLLEINIKEASIYHYDSQIDTSSGEENLIVKEACTKAFPQLNYVEKVFNKKMDIAVDRS
ncbi:hypothetical protein GGI35DRAFT_483258 [Trichoderma velutinum]